MSKGLLEPLMLRFATRAPEEGLLSIGFNANGGPAKTAVSHLLAVSLHAVDLGRADVFLTKEGDICASFKAKDGDIVTVIIVTLEVGEGLRDNEEGRGEAR